MKSSQAILCVVIIIFNTQYMYITCHVLCVNRLKYYCMHVQVDKLKNACEVEATNIADPNTRAHIQIECCTSTESLTSLVLELILTAVVLLSL